MQLPDTNRRKCRGGNPTSAPLTATVGSFSLESTTLMRPADHNGGRKRDGRTRRRSLSRLALVLGVIMLVQAVLFGADTSAARAELIDWTNIPRSGGGNGWNNNGPSGVGASQTFVNIDGTDVDMVVTYSRFMWDNSSVPNIYGTDAPVIPLTSSLRFTNNINDSKSAPGSATGPTIITITFSEPILIDRMALVSLSQFISPSLPRYEWIEARAFDADANLLLATSVVGDSYDLNGSVVVRADSPLVLNDGSGVYFGRGTSIQSTSCPTTVGPCGYDRLTLKYQATPVQRIELVHFATLGGNVDDTRPTGVNGRTSIAIEGITFSVPQEVILYDWADAPDMGVGNGPGDYSTRNEDNGPSHVIIPELYLGAQVDAENDGQPTANANGDDNNPAAGPDDEDGVVVADLALTEGDAAIVRVTATNLTDDPATLTGWIDFNGDGLFAAGEAASVAVPAGSAATQVILDFGTVPSDVAGRVYARFRLSTDDAAMAPTGPASDGEVEDYAVAIAAAPEFDWGDAPDSCLTTAANNGPSHGIVPGLTIGQLIDPEVDGQPNATATGDDTNNLDDEDGVAVTQLTVVEGGTAAITVNVVNTTGQAATLYGWIDLDNSGTFDPDERVEIAVPTGTNNVPFTLDFGAVPTGFTGAVCARFRLSTDDAAANPTGPATDGEVEDYQITIVAEQRDWGDAPDSCLTTAANNGPSHGIVPGLTIGQLIDPEVDGQPNATATGDDTNNLDDEDGVAVTQLTVVEGGTAAITVNVVNTTGQAATLYGWIDLDNSGTFDPDERVEIAVPTGTNNVPFTLDFGAVPTGFTGAVCARFRLSTDDAAANPTGPATDGEVEDYQITIVAAPDYDWGDAPDTGAGIGAANYATLVADNGPSHRIVETLYMGALVDAELDGQPNAAADGDDAAPAGAPDDEDGVTVADLTLVEGTSAAVRVTVTNLDSTPAVLYGWIDFDGNGQFDLEERSTVPVLANSTNVEVTLDFGSVPAAGITQTYARFRLSHDGAAAAPIGAATDGEVEDYLVVITSIYDWGDAPDLSPGTGQGEYNTLAGDNGPSHKIIAGLHMGTVVDGESDGQPNTAAAGDDLLPVGSLDDEDGVSGADLTMTAGDSALVNVSVTNLTTAGAVLYGWIDFNENGVFEPSESAQAEVPAGSNNITVLLDFGLVPADGVVETYARFRLSTDNGASSPTGPAANGEVEDYIVTINTMPSAIDLVSLTGSYADDAITVRWTTAVELTTAGFHLYRNTSAARATAARVTDALILTVGLNGGDYRFVDDDVVTGVTYYYWLVEVESGVRADKEYGPVAIRAALPSSRTTFNIFLPLLATGAER